MTDLEREVRTLLDLMLRQDVYEANEACENPICRSLGRLKRITDAPERNGERKNIRT